MVFGIEGRSVVGNLRNVVSWSSRLAGLAFLCVCSLAGEVSAQAPAAAPPEVSVPAAAPVAYAPPRITKEDDKKWNSTRTVKFQYALRAIAPTSAETKELVEGANLFVDRMTLPENLPNLYRNVIGKAKAPVESSLTNAAPKLILLKALTARAAELLAENPPHHPDIQLNLVILLESLNAQATVTFPPSSVPFTGAYKTFVSVLESQTSPLQCKIHAASGLGRIGRDAKVGVPGGDLSVVQRNDIAISLAKALVATESQGLDDGRVWFRGSVAKALGDCGVAFDLNGGSGFIDALLQTATNPTEHLRVRALALRAATQLSWNGTTNVPLVLHETTKLILEVAKGYNAAIAAKKGLRNADFPHANMDLYLAFQPMTAEQANKEKWGLLNQITRPGIGQNGPAVKAAYEVVRPVIQHILSNTKTPVTIPAAQITALEAWVKANAPTDRKPTTASPQAVP